MPSLTGRGKSQCLTGREAEAAFWAETRVEVRLLESSVAAGSELSDSITITLRMDPRMLARIKRMARSRYLNYQSAYDRSNG